MLRPAAPDRGRQREVRSSQTERHDATFTVKGAVTLLMTDFGITPKALLGIFRRTPNHSHLQACWQFHSA
jgi:hypothetical protein